MLLGFVYMRRERSLSCGRKKCVSESWITLRVFCVVVFSVIMNFLVSAVTAFLRKEFHHCMHFYSSSPFYAHTVHNRRLTIKCVTNSTIEPFSNSSFFSWCEWNAICTQPWNMKKLTVPLCKEKIDFLWLRSRHIFRYGKGQLPLQFSRVSSHALKTYVNPFHLKWPKE